MKRLLNCITAALRAGFKRHRKADRFAAERALVWKVYKDAQRRRDTRDMNRASAEMQRITHAQLRAELGL